MPYSVYILLCADGTYYTGVTTDVVRRLNEHNSTKKGARYTSTRRPVQLVYEESQPDRSLAQQREYIVRKLPRVQKEVLMKNCCPPRN
jgi:putative endonuclease